ncbi:GyrI-like domain-containing protein [Humibacillus xanthopallidus]|uniref:GyrI-like domain-containing protein n=1 Tax=Humibacillus xanthopallidus TaxID=412689 RepID=UPI00384DFC13
MTPTNDGHRIELLYRATTAPRLVEVPCLRFLCLDGHGDPNTSPAYSAAVKALYSVSYAAKFDVKKVGGPNFKVSALEGLWWAEDLSTFLTGDRSQWHWTLMIRQPNAVTDDRLTHLAHQAAAKTSLPAAAELRLTSFEEGRAAQVLHVGPYATEASTIAKLHDFIREHGFALDGHRHKHHEIYLGDPRRADPDKLRTIIRQPYTAA